MARLYADEDFPKPVVNVLRALGHDILTVQEAGRGGQKIPDADVLSFAVSQGRAVLTRNRRHFIKLHARMQPHSGIIVGTDDKDFSGQAGRIQQALLDHPVLDNQLIRVNRLPTP